MKKAVNLPVEYILVLQEINDDEHENVANLSHSLRISYKRMLHIIRELQHKGLIQFSDYMSVKLSRKGDRLLKQLWPSSPKAAIY
jgi:Mn-dependent DtxR family transcriptional regulator